MYVLYVLCSHLFYWCSLYAVRCRYECWYNNNYCSLLERWPRLIKQETNELKCWIAIFQNSRDMKSSKQTYSVCVYSKINVIYVSLFTSMVSPISIIVVKGIFVEWQMENVNRGCIVIQLLLANHNSIHNTQFESNVKKLMWNIDEINRNGT